MGISNYYPAYIVSFVKLFNCFNSFTVVLYLWAILDNVSPLTTVYSSSLPLSFNSAYKVLQQEGNLVYEYNPFRNYRLSKQAFEY